MYQAFHNLKRDIEDFVVRLDRFIQDAGIKLAQEAAMLKVEIEGLHGEISA